METATKVATEAPRVILPSTQFHRVRKSVHFVCFLIFLLLPLFNILRFDIPRQRFYFFGAVLWPSEFSIIFFALMFLLFLLVVSAMLYGRMYCSYLCPQMIFSEAAASLQSGIAKIIKKKLGKAPETTRDLVAGAIFYSLLMVASVFLAFVFISYFVEPRDLFHRLFSLDVRTAGGIAGASTTLFTFLDFAFVRQRFCTSICPYGYLQGMLSDRHTLLVHYDDPAMACIRCGKCERACFMGIDIRNSAHQIECTHCGDCIDACSLVLGKLGKKPVIRYAWGEAASANQRSWRQRLGLHDGKRIAVLALLIVYASALYLTIHLRQPVLIRVVADRSSLYTIGADGLVHNRFRFMASNRGKQDAKVTLTLQQLPEAHVVGLENGVGLRPGESTQQEFDVAVAARQVEPGVNHFTILANVNPAQSQDTFEVTFITPMDAPSPNATSSEKEKP